MSEAIVCVDQHLSREVLVKLLKAGTDPSRILDELAALAAIRSKHVVQIYDVIRNDDGDVVAIVEELIAGTDLFAVPPLSTLEEFLKCAYSIASGICDIHTHGIVHRDIKPNNMKFDADGCLKIFDFGLARFEGVNSETITMIGTPGYMAPELGTKGVGGKIAFTAAIDAFAFAATLLQVLLGKLPSSMMNFPPTIAAVDSFSSAPFPIPSDLLASLDSCFSAVPSGRPSVCIIKALLAKHMLRDKHRALLVSGGKEYVLDKTQRLVQIGNDHLGKFNLRYDGLDFYIDYISGDIFLNNAQITSTTLLPGSCVVVVGASTLGSARLSVSIDVTNPEVVL